MTFREYGPQLAGRAVYNKAKRMEYKKLFTLWLPAVFVLSVLISIVYIFSFKDVTFLSPAFSLGKGGFWEVILSVFVYSFGAANGLNLVILACSLVLLLIVEVFSIIRLFKLRKTEESGRLKMLFRFLVAQAVGAGALLAGFLAVLAVSLGAAFLYGYVDLKMSLKEAASGSVTNDEEIVKLIQGSSSVINVYDSAGEFGMVLTKRGLKKKDKLTTYEGIVLPLLMKVAGKDAEGRSFFIPSAGGIVYTNFTKGRTEKIIIELVFNHLKNHSNPAISSRFEKTRKPAVTYLDDQAYAPYVKKKRAEINQKTLSDFQDLIASNKRIVSECRVIDADNAKLVAEQESDYRQNCVLQVDYSNCGEFKLNIDENKKASREVADVCRENKILLDSQYKELEQLKADIEKAASSDTEEELRELTSGLYFPDTKNIYMKVTPGQGAFAYLDTLLHETFHHYSGGGSELPIFLNEGLTDYLTYKSFKLSDKEMIDVSGYFKEIQALLALLEKIPESELLAAYFANDAEMLEAPFKKYFPEVDYTIFLSKGDSMYRETYEEIGSTFNLSFWDTSFDHPAIRDLRTFLGLEPTRFY